MELFELVMRNIRVLNLTIVPLNFYKDAIKLCEDIDVDDSVFIAFAEFLNAKLWTGDKKLINGLLKKGFKRLLTTEELFRDFIDKERK